MKITSSAFTVSDYCEAMKRKEIIVNRDYQRSSKVWPPQARSFLIETILLDCPIPKLSLYQITDFPCLVSDPGTSLPKLIFLDKGATSYPKPDEVYTFFFIRILILL